jgi:hypothetical protein
MSSNNDSTQYYYTMTGEKRPVEHPTEEAVWHPTSHETTTETINIDGVDITKETQVHTDASGHTNSKVTVTTSGPSHGHGDSTVFSDDHSLIAQKAHEREMQDAEALKKVE